MKLRGNKRRVLLLSILFAMLLSQTAFGYTKKDGTITSASVKIRSSADASSSVVGSTVKDSKVTIIGEEKDSSGTVWYQVQVNANTTGYIRSDLLKTEASASDAQSESNTGSEVKQTSGTGALIPESSNIRNAAVDGDVVITLSKGAVVTIIGETTGSDSKKWYQVNFIKDSKTYTGYVRADLIDTNAQVATTSDDGQTKESTEETALETEQTQTTTTTNTTDCSLKSLTLSEGEITPEFSSDVTEYTITVPEGTIEIAISAVVTDDKAQITAADGFKDLLSGLNSASIVIEAADGSSQTYHFSIIVGDISATTAELVEEPEVAETESVVEETETEDTTDLVALEEYEKYKALAEKRLIYMCALGFLLAVALVIILNLALKIKDLSEDEDDEDEDEEEEEEEATSEPKPKKERKSLFAKREYVKLEEEQVPELKETLTQKEQARRADQKAEKSVFMPDLKEEAENEAAQNYENASGYEETGLDDEFEFEFINLDVKNRK